MISLAETEKLHQLLIENFGGSAGIRDKGALASALERPFQTFGNSELYPGVLEKASALIESILYNHPFVDGNKRTGYVLMRLFLLSSNMDIVASEDLKFEFVIGIASGEMKFDEISQWLKDFTAEPD